MEKRGFSRLSAKNLSYLFCLFSGLDVSKLNRDQGFLCTCSEYCSVLFTVDMRQLACSQLKAAILKKWQETDGQLALFEKKSRRHDYLNLFLHSIIK